MTDATAVVRFRIGGLLRFLSHAETMRLLERALVRAGVPIKYTLGFNPHPKLSLPLPRSVGVESDDELLAVKLLETDGIAVGQCSSQGDSTWSAQTKKKLADELPDDIVLHSVSVVKSSTRFYPRLAEYVFNLMPNNLSVRVEEITNTITEILGRDTLTIERKTPTQREGRRIDVKPFLKSIRVENTQVMAECYVSNAGTIRVDEIMTLLNVTSGDLDGPIRRTNVAWEIA